MPLDGVNYISQMNLNNPVGAVDTVNMIDDFLREMKKVIQQSFPNINAPANINSTELNNLKSYLVRNGSSWDMKGSSIINTVSADNDNAIEPRSYNDSRYLRASQNLWDVPDKNSAMANLLNGMGTDGSAYTAMRAMVNNFVYPVWSVYTCLRDDNPNAALGVGTWAKFAEGKTIVGEGAYTDSRGDFRYFAKWQTGGEYAHVLGSNEMPAHNHSTKTVAANISLDSGGSTRRLMATNNGYTNDGDLIGSSGGGTAHENMQPYQVAYYWVRTA